MDAMACGVLTGHLLECGGQATGGYFAEPGLKDVPDVDRIGFPIAEVRNDRSITITKPPGSGGRIDRHTIVEQILYEMHDPGGLHHARRDARRHRSRSRRDGRATKCGSAARADTRGPTR